MKVIKLILLYMIITNLYACGLAPKPITERTLILGDMEFKESIPEEFISWKCKDYSYGGRTLVEVGYLPLPEHYDYMQISLLKDAMVALKGNNEGSDRYAQLNNSEKKEVDSKINKEMHEYFNNKLGFVLYDDTNTGEIVLYQRAGLRHRWDWGSKNSSYSFVITTDGTGLFYDFSTADDDGKKSEADDNYKCKRQM